MGDDSVFASLQQVAGVRYNRAEYNQDIIDTYVLRKAREKGIRLPTGGPPDEYKYLGAHVETPTAGTSHHVIYVDVSSMYPSLLLTLNGSPETLVGTATDLAESPYDEDDCVWGYVDTRPVKHLSKGEDWHQYTDGGYKMVYDPHAPETKWTCDEGDGPRYEKLYFLDHDTQKGFLTECVEELIELKNRYRGTSLYGSTKRVTNCFTPDTEVLTPEGVVNIRDLDVGDEVYSFDRKTETMEVKPVTETFAYPDYDGEIVDLGAGKQSNIDQRVTPNHEFLVRKNNPNGQTWDGYRSREVQELDEYSNYELPNGWDYESSGFFDARVDLAELVQRHTDVDVTISDDGERMSACHGQQLTPRYMDTEDFVELLAWYVTEGYCYDADSGNYNIFLSQRTDEGRDRIASLLDRAVGYYYSHDSGYQFSSKPISRLLSSLCGHKSQNKRLPSFVFQMMEERRELLFEALMEGDGDSADDSYRYSTQSERLRDDMMQLALTLGITPQYGRDSETWRVYCNETKGTLRMHRSADWLENDDVDTDGVYCVEVADNNTLVAGRNGVMSVTKNSIYGVCGFATEDSSFRLFDWRLAEAITLCGRKMIQYSRDYVLDYLHDAGYTDAYAALGDTDGVGISVPSASTRHEAMTVVEEAVDALNGEGYDTFFREQMGVPPENHHGAIEIESYAPKVFVPAKSLPYGDVGRKKRYIEWVTWDEDDGECDEVSITGLEYVRSDTAPLIQEAQWAFAETLRLDDGEARAQLFPQLREWAEAIQSGDIELDRVCKRKGIGQPLSEYGSTSRRASTFYRGAKYANAHVDGVTVQRGDKPRLVHVAGVEGDYPSTYTAVTAEDGDPVDAVTVPDPSQLPDAFVVDWDAHWTAFREALKPLLETRFGGEAWSQVLHDHEQTGLASFEA